MLLKRILLLLLSFCAGTAVSAGSFAFLIVIGVIPRLLRRAQMNSRIMLAENIIILGILFGCVMSLWERSTAGLPVTDAVLSQAAEMTSVQAAAAAAFAAAISGISHLLIAIYGISAGIFVGGIAVSLAEILHTFPIIFRRFHLTEGLSWIMCAMAIGKVCGALFSFCGGYGY